MLNFFKSIKASFKKNPIVFIFGIIASVCLISQAYLRQGLWLDEIAILENLKNKTYLELLQPLDIYQVAPIFFLWVEKTFWYLGNFLSIDVDYTLRIYPLLCGLGVLVLYYPVVKKLTNSKFISTLSYGLLIFNPVFIYYSSEVKQYICELFYCLLLIYSYLKYKSGNWNLKNNIKYILISIFGFLNSFTICFAFLGLGLYDGYNLLLKKKLFKNLNIKNSWKVYISTNLIIFLFILIYYLSFYTNHPTQEFMFDFWSWMNGFLEFNSFYLNYVFELTLYLFSYNHFSFYFIIIGLLSFLLLKNKLTFILSFCFIVIHILLSALEIYPLVVRLCLCWMIFIPIMFANIIYQIIVVFGGKFLKKYINNNIILSIITFIIVYIEIQPRKFPIYYHFHFYPKAVFKYISDNYKKDDVVVLPYRDTPFVIINKDYLGNIPESAVQELDLSNRIDIASYKRVIMSQYPEGGDYFINDLFDKLAIPQSQRRWILGSRLNESLFLAIYNPKFLNAKRQWIIVNANSLSSAFSINSVLLIGNSNKRLISCNQIVENQIVCLVSNGNADNNINKKHIIY